MRSRRLPLLGALLLAPLAGHLLPWTWGRLDPRLAVSGPSWRVAVWDASHPDAWTVNPARPQEDPWGRVLTWRDGGAELVADAWDRDLYRLPHDAQRSPYARAYSRGPDGVDQQGGGDDLLLYHPRDPKLLLFQLLRRLLALCAGGVALLYLLVRERRALAARRWLAPALGGLASVALAWPVSEAWALLAQESPPWSLPSLLLTAAGGGAVCALAALPPRPDPD